MQDFGMMSENKVYNCLYGLPNSKYRGVKPDQLRYYVTYNEARRYLSELILVNDLNRSDLHLISEDNSSKEQESSIHVSRIAHHGGRSSH